MSGFGFSGGFGQNNQQQNTGFGGFGQAANTTANTGKVIYISRDHGAIDVEELKLTNFF